MNTLFGIITLVVGVALGFTTLYESANALLTPPKKASALKLTMLLTASSVAMFGGTYLGKLNDLFHPTPTSASQTLDGRWWGLLLVMLLFLGLYFALAKIRKAPMSKALNNDVQPLIGDHLP